MKRALLVGIDTYDSFNSLAGCVNDVNALTPLRARHADASPNFHCRAYTSNGHRVDRRALLEAVEPEAEPEHSEHQAIFAILQRCRAAKLIEPVGADHMYFAAMQSKACRLTPLGKHY